MRRYASRLAVPLALAFTAPLAAQQPDTAAAETPKDQKWDVETSLGFPRTLSFETAEGTWINLDVSPDGGTIVFDLLGDLYALPIGGGEARALTSGPAFDHLPRFSPDGRTIVYVSDDDGSDQLWLMDADGSNPRKLSSVSDQYPTNPTWTPDGKYVVAKRHVVDVRSLGGGELWMWHVEGGDPVRLVEKRSFTSELNEPAVSPDGEWVYYSFAGPFDYNRDPHAGIFQVNRYSRLTGETEPVTRDAGGAVRPLPSPDGRKLAFVRRVGTETLLFVRDLRTGGERAVFDGLQRDQMETWVVHGAYPAYDWLPDSRRLAIFFDGGIHLVDTETGTTSPVPFRARVDQRLAELAHFDQSQVLGDPEWVDAKLIRWPSFAPDGNRLVFQAVGRIWQMAVPAGRPERVTDGDRLEFAPAVSPDGQWVAFTTWDADEGGALWKARLRPGRTSRPERLAAAQDQFANPAWSPDGRTIAFVQGSGQLARGGDLGDEWFLRIRTVSADGGPRGDVARTASRGANRAMPRITWSADGRRLLFFESQDDKTLLTSVQLDGTDERHLVSNEIAEEIIASPDGEWVAFKELHNVYVAPLPRAGGEPVNIAASGSGMPVKQLSEWGGDWIAWAPDSRSLSWNLGPTVVRQRLAAIYAEGASGGGGEGASEAERWGNLAEPGETFTVSLRVPRARPEGTVALTGARVVTMRGEEVIENGTVVVHGNRIAAVGPAADVAVPQGARVVDVAGKTIIPGLVDVHAHMGYMALDINPDRPWQYAANLAYGVTTTHDPSAATQLVFSQSELVEAGEVVGPRIYSTGFILYGARNPNRAVVKSLEDARAHLKRLKALGAFSVKSYNQRRRDARQWIMKAAHEQKMHVYPEGGSMLEQNLTQMIDGHTGIEHALPIAELYEDAIRLTAESGTGYTPTLIVGYGGIWGENYWYQVEDVFRNERLLRFTPRGIIDARARRRLLAPEEEFYHFELARTADRIEDAGGHVQLGAHGQLQGLGAHWELWMFEQGGMSPHEALHTATLAGARYLGLGDHLGSIEAGKLADLVVLDANPLADIRASDDVRMVMKNGVLYDDGLAEIWPKQRPAEPLRF